MINLINLRAHNHISEKKLRPLYWMDGGRRRAVMIKSQAISRAALVFNLKRRRVDGRMGSVAACIRTRLHFALSTWTPWNNVEHIVFYNIWVVFT